MIDVQAARAPARASFALPAFHNNLGGFAVRPLTGTHPHRADAVELGVLTTEAELSALAPEWAALWRRVPDASPFVSPQWLLAWWRTLGGGPLRVFTARALGRADGRLVAVLPMFVWHDAGVRRLLPVGISVSDWFDLLAEPRWQPSVLALLAPALGWGEGVGGRDWDRAELHEVPQGSSLLWLSGTGLRPLAQRQSACPVLDLDRYAMLGRRAGPVRNLRRSRQRAEEIGPVRAEPIDTRSAPDRVRPALEELFALHAASWRARGKSGVLGGPTVQAFHQEAAAGLAAEGALLLLRLHVGRALAGVLYGFLRGDRAYAYAIGTDPTLARIAPGTLLVGAAIEAAQAAGATRFDFLRGQEPYKYAWGAEDEATMQVVLAPPVPAPGSLRARPAPPPGRSFVAEGPSP